MNENYTKGVRKVLTYAKEESIRLGQTYIGSEHIFLGILKDTNGSASSTLKIIGCNFVKSIILNFDYLPFLAEV